MIKEKNEYLSEYYREQKEAEKAKLKSMTFPKKLDYIWTYYKAPILITTMVLLLAFFLGRHLILNNQECILYTMIINGNTAPGEDPASGLFEDFLAEENLDPGDYKADYHSGLSISLKENGEVSDIQVFSAAAAILMSGSVDNVLTDEETLVMLAEKGFIMPAGQYLTEEELAAYEKEDKLLYAVDPETNEKTAFGISLAESDKINKSGLFMKPGAYGMVYRAPHMENSMDFLDFLKL